MLSQSEDVAEMTATPQVEMETQKYQIIRNKVVPMSQTGTEQEDMSVALFDLSLLDTPHPPLMLPELEEPPPVFPELAIPLPKPEEVVADPQPFKSLKKTSRQDRARAEREAMQANMVQEKCRQLCAELFFRTQAPVSSVGFTSAMRGEGKSFLSMVTAAVLALESDAPVTLLECTWEHPDFADHFEIASTPGLAEWVRGECTKEEIRHKVAANLTVIPAGNARLQRLKLLQMLRKRGLAQLLTQSNELLVVDLPAMVPAGEGALAATLLESLVVVVQATKTPERLIVETCQQLSGLPVHGLLLNQVQSTIPGWLRQIL